MNTNIYGDFQTCINVPLTLFRNWLGFVTRICFRWIKWVTFERIDFREINIRELQLIRQK